MYEILCCSCDLISQPIVFFILIFFSFTYFTQASSNRDGLYAFADECIETCNDAAVFCRVLQRFEGSSSHNNNSTNNNDGSGQPRFIRSLLEVPLNYLRKFSNSTEWKFQLVRVLTENVTIEYSKYSYVTQQDREDLHMTVTTIFSVCKEALWRPYDYVVLSECGVLADQYPGILVSTLQYFLQRHKDTGFPPWYEDKDDLDITDVLMVENQRKLLGDEDSVAALNKTIDSIKAKFHLVD